MVMLTKNAVPDHRDEDYERHLNRIDQGSRSASGPTLGTNEAKYAEEDRNDHARNDGSQKSEIPGRLPPARRRFGHAPMILMPLQQTSGRTSEARGLRRALQQYTHNSC